MSKFHIKSKFHINGEGEPGKCSAQAGNCPFGSEDMHFGTADDARKAYEYSQNAMIAATHRREALALTQAQYREIFNRDSIYRWSNSAITLPPDWQDAEHGGIDPAKTTKLYASMVATLKNNSLQLAKLRGEGEIKALQNVIYEIAKATKSHSKNRAYAALVLTSHLRKDFKKFDLPELDEQREALIAHWEDTRRGEPGQGFNGPKYRVEGGFNTSLNQHSIKDLKSAQDILDRDYSTWTDDDKKELDRVTKDQVDNWSGLRQRLVDTSDPRPVKWNGYASGENYSAITYALKKGVANSIYYKQTLAKDSKLMSEIFSK